MLAELASHSPLLQNMVRASAFTDSTQGSHMKQASSAEDFVVILQKTTSRDPAGTINLLDSRLVEHLHSYIENSNSTENQNTFLVQNVKSILRNITEAHQEANN